jgi:hypothetical protein
MTDPVNLTILDTLTMKAPDGSNFVNIKAIQPSSNELYLEITKGIKLEEVLYGNDANGIVLQTTLFNPSSYDPSSIETVSLLQMNKGIQFKDTGQVMTVLENDHTKTKLQKKANYSPSTNPNDWCNLFCTKINRADRTSVLDDPVLATDKGFFVEKDFSTFGFVATTSDPVKGTGGGAIKMGTGLTGPGCPPLFNLTGTMFTPSDQFGSYPTSGDYWTYDSTYKKLSRSGHLMFERVYSGEYDTLFLTRADYNADIGPAKLANLNLGMLTAINGLNIPTLTAENADEVNRPVGSLWLRTDL